KNETESESGSNGSNGSNSTQLLEKVKPLTETLLKLYALILPYWAIASERATTAWSQIKPYYEKYYMPEMAECAIGLILMFFGGQYAMTIACYTALQISGSQTKEQSISLLFVPFFFFFLKKKGGKSYMSEHFKKKKKKRFAAKEAFEKDETARKYVDENNDGQISSDELVPAARKFLQGSSEEKLKAITNLKAVILAVDPQE
ncbi:hypothetical protein RFI_36403, partial [Reticulomyxa filosa]